MPATIFIVAFIAGLLMFLRPAGTKVQRIGEMILFAAIFALLIALAPSVVKLLHA